jgi:hypothetical protein
MKIKITKAGPWKIGANTRHFHIGDTVESGGDVPDNIIEDMLRCGYAEPCKGRPKIETKEVKSEEVKESKAGKRRNKK